MKTTKTVVVSNLIRNHWFYSIDVKNDDYKNNVNFPTCNYNLNILQCVIVY
jgi:hypothetical protein